MSDERYPVDEHFPFDPGLSPKTMTGQRRSMPDLLRTIDDRFVAQIRWEVWLRENPESAERYQPSTDNPQHWQDR